MQFPPSRHLIPTRREDKARERATAEMSRARTFRDVTRRKHEEIDFFFLACEYLRGAIACVISPARFDFADIICIYIDPRVNASVQKSVQKREYIALSCVITSAIIIARAETVYIRNRATLFITAQICKCILLAFLAERCYRSLSVCFIAGRMVSLSLSRPVNTQRQFLSCQ